MSENRDRMRDEIDNLASGMSKLELSQRRKKKRNAFDAIVIFLLIAGVVYILLDNYL